MACHFCSNNCVSPPNLEPKRRRSTSGVRFTTVDGLALNQNALVLDPTEIAKTGANCQYTFWCPVLSSARKMVFKNPDTEELPMISPAQA
jgi:hypothetical protein